MLASARSLFVPLIRKSAQRTEGPKAHTRAAPCEEGGVGMTSRPYRVLIRQLSQFSRADVASGCPEAPGPRRTGLAMELICRLVSSMMWAAEASTRWV